LLSASIILLSASLRSAEPVGKPYVFKTVGDRELRLYVVEPQVQVEPPAQPKR